MGKCTSKICSIKYIAKHRYWGKRSTTRVVSKAVGIPVVGVGGLGLGVGVVACGVGVAAAAASVALAVGIVAIPSYYGYKRYKDYRYRKEDLSEQYEYRKINKLMNGVLVIMNCYTDDPLYQEFVTSYNDAINSNTTTPKLFGLNGRLDNLTYISYFPELEYFNQRISPVVYFVPMGRDCDEYDMLTNQYAHCEIHIHLSHILGDIGGHSFHSLMSKTFPDNIRSNTDSEEGIYLNRMESFEIAFQKEETRISGDIVSIVEREIFYHHHYY
jgi:hypothetical protein